MVIRDGCNSSMARQVLCAGRNRNNTRKVAIYLRISALEMESAGKLNREFIEWEFHIADSRYEKKKNTLRLWTSITNNTCKRIDRHSKYLSKSDVRGSVDGGVVC